MTTQPPVYADIEALLVPWLANQLGVRVCTDLPANLEAVAPVVQVTRIGGADDTFTLDRAGVDIDCFATARQDAVNLAAQCRDALRFALPGTTVAGTYVARVETLSGPAWRPYDNTAVRRFGGSFQLITQKGQNP